MNHSWYQLSIATPGSGRARTRSGLAICEPAISELRAHVLRSGLPPTSIAALSATGPWMTLRPVNNPAAGGSADADGPALFRNDPPRSRVCTLAQTDQSRLSRLPL